MAPQAARAAAKLGVDAGGGRTRPALSRVPQCVRGCAVAPAPAPPLARADAERAALALAAAQPALGVRLRAVRVTVAARGGGGGGGGGGVGDVPALLLRGVSAEFAPGALCALMGPSGSGKSTLITALALGRCSSGELLANGRPYAAVARQMIVTVPQEDVLLPALSALEMLTFAAELRLPAELGAPARAAAAAHVLRRLRFTDASMRTRIGSADARGGLSGGERKRVSIALELLSNPPVLLVDEPTSGLDTSTASGVVRTLRALARDEGRTVICAVHQPSSRLFGAFDQLVLLSTGAVAYAGAADGAASHFASLGVPGALRPLAHESSAEFVLRALSGDGGSDQDEGAHANGAERIVELWAAAEAAAEAARVAGAARAGGGGGVGGAVPAGGDARADPLAPYRAHADGAPRVWAQARVLLARRLRATLNDRRALARACALKALTGVLVGGIWHGAARSPSFRDGTRAVSSALFLLVNNSAMDAVTDAILLVTSDGRLLAREYANGHFATNAYYLALQAAVMARATVGGLLIVAPARALIGLSPTAAQAVAFFSVLTAVSCIGATLGVLVGALAGDVDAARSAIVPTLGPLLLFSGFLIPRTLIPPLFKWAYYASFFQYALGALELNELAGARFRADCPAERVLAAARALVGSALGAQRDELRAAAAGLPADVRANLTCAAARALALGGLWPAGAAGAAGAVAERDEALAACGSSGAPLDAPPLNASAALGMLACAARAAAAGASRANACSTEAAGAPPARVAGVDAARDAAAGLRAALLPDVRECNGVDLLAELGLWPPAYGGIGGHTTILALYLAALMIAARWAVARRIRVLVTAEWVDERRAKRQ
ncbi:hypothetical protein KFE25_008215 [Diacronema lutheri]|uniref:ABC transporter domain-containing protein n=1 Tax=Diacronema lutheri TaxID=2081491 RepID=A0A8J6CD77_DIALT|nr:hypothetical protein KFE25_008215 [Diacronema lutheri]